MPDFHVIQGGMGIGVSNWRLARTVSMRGQLGVVSGTGLAVLLSRHLQDGDPTGDMRRALAAFPIPRITETILQLYYRPANPQGVSAAPIKRSHYRIPPMPIVQCSQPLLELTVAANFVEVYLAKEGHSGVVGINLLEKIQAPTLASLYGAMLAGVDYVLMGAGIPRFIPGMLDALAAGQPAELRMDVANAAPGENYMSRLDPAAIWAAAAPVIARPKFLAIISSATLAMTMARKSNGRIDGFVVELAVAGGHNAPPRGPMTLNEKGEPIYGERDNPDIDKIRDVGLPFYLAGGFGSPAGLARALSYGAAGIQVGTLFAFCEESGLDPKLKAKVRAQAMAGTTGVLTDPVASPTGFPFKVLQMPGTISDPEVYAHRTRICDFGYLRQAYKKDDGTVGYRCAAEPVTAYIKKGGDIAQTVGRKCLCNGLFAALGLGQPTNDGTTEPPIMTVGDDVVNLPDIMNWAAASGTSDTYTAEDVLSYLLAGSHVEAAAALRGAQTAPA